MIEFPYSAEQWQPVRDAADSFLAAVEADDEVAAEAQLTQLRSSLDGLRQQFGEHPILLETEADFCFDIEQASSLYERAIKLSRENDLPTGSIFLSYIESIISADGDLSIAQSLLDECRQEIQTTGDENQVADWNDLQATIQDRLEA